MAERTGSYPPVGSPDRYDQIIKRGRSMRRRRQIARTAGVGGAAAVLAILLFGAVAALGGGSNGDKVVADELPVTTTSTTTTSTTTTTIDPTKMTVAVDTDARTISVVDPLSPVDLDSQQCVLVTLSGVDAQFIAEAHVCDYVPNADAYIEPIALEQGDGTQVGCAAVANRIPDPAALEAAPKVPASTTFSYSLPDQLAPGAYALEVSATSGVGDGCAGSSPGDDEVESFNGTTAEFVVG